MEVRLSVAIEVEVGAVVAASLSLPSAIHSSSSILSTHLLDYALGTLSVSDSLCIPNCYTPTYTSHNRRRDYDNA